MWASENITGRRRDIDLRTCTVYKQKSLKVWVRMLVEKRVFGRVWLIGSGRVTCHMLSQPQACISVSPFQHRSKWQRGLRRRSAAACLLRLWVRIPPVAWMSVCCECCVLSGRGLCDGLITRPEESYQLWCVVVCDLWISRMRRPWPTFGRSAQKQSY